MELDEFDTKTKSNEGAEIELLSLKTRAKSGVFIKVLGIDSDLFQDLKAQRSRELMDAVQARGPGNVEILKTIAESQSQLAQLTASLAAHAKEATQAARQVSEDSMQAHRESTLAFRGMKKEINKLGIEQRRDRVGEPF